VEQLGPNAKSIASDLIGHISEDQVQQWSQGTASDWAMESFKVAKDGPTPRGKFKARVSAERGLYGHGNARCRTSSKGGVRLAFVLKSDPWAEKSVILRAQTSAWGERMAFLPF